MAAKDKTVIVESKVYDRDLGLQLAVRKTKDLGKQVVLVGVFDGSTQGEFAQGGRTPERPETLIPEYAAYLEYGTQHIPPHAWMRGTVERNQRSYDNIMARALPRVQDGKRGPASVLHELGIQVEGDLKIELTVQELIDTGSLRNSITHRLRKNDGPSGN